MGLLGTVVMEVDNVMDIIEDTERLLPRQRIYPRIDLNQSRLQKQADMEV